MDLTQLLPEERALYLIAKHFNNIRGLLGSPKIECLKVACYSTFITTQQMRDIPLAEVSYYWGSVYSKALEVLNSPENYIEAISDPKYQVM